MRPVEKGGPAYLPGRSARRDRRRSPGYRADANSISERPVIGGREASTLVNQPYVSQCSECMHGRVRKAFHLDYVSDEELVCDKQMLSRYQGARSFGGGQGVAPKGRNANR